MYKHNERQFWTEFLEIYKSLPALWCVKSPEYSNRGLKFDAYEILVGKLREIDPKADRDYAVRKINNFRNSYRRELNKQKKRQQREAGNGGKYQFVSSLWYFDLLNFLNDQTSNFEVESKAYESESYESYNTTEEVIPDFKPRPSKRQCSDRERNEEELDQGNLTPTPFALHHNKESNDAAILAKSWETQYSELPCEQKVFVRKLFSDVLFNGCLGKLNEYVVLAVNNIMESKGSSYSP